MYADLGDRRVGVVVEDVTAEAPGEEHVLTASRDVGGLVRASESLLDESSSSSSSSSGDGVSGEQGVLKFRVRHSPGRDVVVVQDT